MEENTILKIKGTVRYITFRNERNYYTVARISNTEDQKSITVVGNIEKLETGMTYLFYGKYVEHPRYGIQFAFQSAEMALPEEEEGIVRFLSSETFPGVGKKTAEKIVEQLGPDCLGQIRKDSSVLDGLDLSEKVKQSIAAGLNRTESGVEKLIEFLNVHEISMRYLPRIQQLYGEDAIAVIQENPYQLLQDIHDIGFRTADQIAQKLGFSEDDERRRYAYLLFQCSSYCFSTGDTYIPTENLESLYERSFPDGAFSYLLEQAVNAGDLYVEEDRIYPQEQWQSEEESAQFLAAFCERKADSDTDIVSEIHAFEKSIGITYDDQQILAIETFFANPVSIMTGGPGTGKTTVVRALVSICHSLYPEASVFCAAPTGRAAKRLAQLADCRSSTIHSLLAWDPDANVFSRNEENPIDVDILIIDEFSMVDNRLFYALLKACVKVKKICIIGDEDQLPSISPGSVLRDLIASGCIPTVRLENIYRQTEGSDIVTLAHEIRNGSAVIPAASEDVSFLSCPLTEIKDQILASVLSMIQIGFDIPDIQVLSPMYEGAAGIHMLNNALQELLNPPDGVKKEVKNGYMVFRIGDKLLQLKNQPEDHVYNGDIGKLADILPASMTESKQTELLVDFGNEEVSYTPDNWNHLTLAYCISVHKAQGSEYPIVLMPFTRQHRILLDKKLIYTAVSRAEKKLLLFGDENVMLAGVMRDERHVRQTTLAEKVKKAFAHSADLVYDID